MHLILDVSRLLSRIDRTGPTGIDRLELAYAKHFLKHKPDCLTLVAAARWGDLKKLPFDRTAGLLTALDRRWKGEPAPLSSLSRKVIRHTANLYLSVCGSAGLYRTLDRSQSRPIYLVLSHQHLDRPNIFEKMKRRSHARIVCFIHDLIPIQFPEYARPGQAERHQLRMETAARLADAVLTNSEHTRACFAPLLARAGRTPKLLVAPLGIDLEPADPMTIPRSLEPYFVCIGTIEPKKNHLLLLNLWRRLSLEFGAQAPRLILIGQRGWENENVIDMLERSPAIKKLVDERGAVSDRELSGLLMGARALLAPTFAEGFGIPIAEALTLGTPVLCSDLPALREVGKNVPEYFDPMDGIAWYRAVIDYAEEDSQRRREQRERSRNWKAPTWTTHFSAVSRLLTALL